jgi:hypothetical protein
MDHASEREERAAIPICKVHTKGKSRFYTIFNSNFHNFYSVCSDDDGVRKAWFDGFWISTVFLDLNLNFNDIEMALFLVSRFFKI